jgi:hypothetical protein
VVVSTRRAWIPLLSIGVAYVGFLVALLVDRLAAPAEYEHGWDLQFGLIALAWSVLALASIVVSITSLLLTRRQVRRLMRGTVVGLNVVVAVATAYVLPWALGSIDTYRSGLTAYQKEVQVCGQPPVIAIAGWGGDILLPKDSDYERLKYSPGDHYLLGTPVYFCTLADAQAHGYRRQPWHAVPP